MAAAWTEENVAELVRLRDFEGLTFTVLGARFGVSRSAAIGKYHRASGSVFRSQEEPRPDTRKLNQSPRYYLNLKPAKNPNSTDTSTPRFAHHAEHVAAVLGAGGYPRLRLEARA